MRSQDRLTYVDRLAEAVAIARQAVTEENGLLEVSRVELDRLSVQAVLSAQESDPSLWPDRAFALRRHLDDESPEPGPFTHVRARRSRYPTETVREWVHVGPYWMTDSPGGYTHCEWDDLEVHEIIDAADRDG